MENAVVDVDQVSEAVKQSVAATEQWSGKQKAYAPDIVDHYNKEADIYEEMYLTMGYHDHEKVNEIASEFITDLQQRESIEVIDLGCGTGLVGDELFKKGGFKNIVGVDASVEMMVIAQKKGSYKETIELWLGKPETFPENLKNRFSLVTCCAVLAEGHCDKKLFDEMIMTAKGRGSIIIFSTRDSYLTDFGYQKRIDELVEEGKWKNVKSILIPKYDKLGDKNLGRYKKTEVRIMAFEIL